MTQTDKILVVEDSEPLRKILAEKLRESGFDVIESGVAEEAIKLGSEHKPALIITDIVMYPMDGIEMSKTIRQSGGWGEKVKIIALTNQNETEEEVRMVGARFDAYFVKADIALEQVVKEARKMLEKK